MGDRTEFTKWWVLLIGLCVLALVVIAGLYVGGVFVERQALKQSHAYKEARNTERATFQAQLTIVENRLLTEKDPEVVENLKMQKRALQQQIEISKRR